MHLFYIPVLFILVFVVMALYYKTMLYNKRRNTNISWIGYMSKIESLLLIFPILRNSPNINEQKIIKKANMAVYLCWSAIVVTFIIIILEF
jgi:hypothetical protein